MTTFKTSRQISATVEQVFATFQPERLARWWGPAGFTNTFHICEFKTGGRWSFIMHGPDGKNYPNENMFSQITSPNKVVITHLSEPKFTLSITLEPSSQGTLLHWAQCIENSEVARNIEHIVVPANEQNLDRLCAELTRK